MSIRQWNIINPSEAKMDFDSKAVSMVFAFLFGVSEVMALIPNIKSNGIIHLVINILKAVSEE